MPGLDQATIDALSANRVRYLREQLRGALDRGDAAQYASVQAEIEALDVPVEKIVAAQDEAAADIADVLGAVDAAGSAP